MIPASVVVWVAIHCGWLWPVGVLLLLLAIVLAIFATPRLGEG
jgi:hypothetical protein